MPKRKKFRKNLSGKHQKICHQHSLGKPNIFEIIVILEKAVENLSREEKQIRCDQEERNSSAITKTG